MGRQIVECRGIAGRFAKRSFGGTTGLSALPTSRLFEQPPVFAVPRFFQLVGRYEAEGGRVDAVAQAGRLGAVIEEVTQVGVAVFAADFGAGHEQGAVYFFDDVLRYERLGKAGPAGAGFEFVRGTKEGFAGDDIDVDAGFFVVPELVFEGGFGPLFLGYVELERGQLLAQGFDGWLAVLRI